MKLFSLPMKLLQVCILLLGLVCSPNLVAKERKVTAVDNYGTGWVVAPYFVVTNNHVVRESDHVVLIKTNRSELRATVIVRDAVNDLALLRVNDPGKLPPAIPLARHSPSMGEQVFTIGYPHPEVMGTNPKLTTGIVNALTGMANDPRTLQVSTPLQAGNSGGPLLNMNGEAVGIVTSKLNAMKMFKWTGDIPQNVNYAVKLNYLHALIESVNRPGKSSIQILPRKRNNLVNLTQQLQDSIVLIKSGVPTAETIPVKKNDLSDKKENQIVTKSKTLAVFVYMEQGDYEILNDLDDTATYSRNTARLIDSMIKDIKRKTLTVSHLQYNSGAKWRYYDVYQFGDGQRLCKKYKVDYLLAVKNTYDTIVYGQEELDFVLRDCVANTYSQHFYNITFNQQDKFNYETDIRASAKSFLTEHLKKRN